MQSIRRQDRFPAVTATSLLRQLSFKSGAEVKQNRGGPLLGGQLQLADQTIAEKPDFIEMMGANIEELFRADFVIEMNHGDISCQLIVEPVHCRSSLTLSTSFDTPSSS